MKDLNLKFLDAISHLSAVEFCGLARVMNVKIATPNPDADPSDPSTNFIARPFEDILEDILSKYKDYSREKKRNLLRIVSKCR